MKYYLSIGGASGGIYGIRLFEELIESGQEVHLTISGGAKKILKHESDPYTAALELMKSKTTLSTG